MEELGFVKGENCNREGCKGIIDEHEKRGCSCHICPPCSSCTEPRGFCPECKWEESEDPIPESNFSEPDNKLMEAFKLKPLDNTKIDWHSYLHSNSSMIKKGVYPEGTTQEEVRKVVDGTFGGRFKSFGYGKFEFVAYTD